MKYYFCEQCNKRIEEPNLLSLRKPNWPSGLKGYEEFMKAIDRENEMEPVRFYHKTVRFLHRNGWSAGSEYYNCGPLHEETEMEYFLFVTCK